MREGVIVAAIVLFGLSTTASGQIFAEHRESLAGIGPMRVEVIVIQHPELARELPTAVIGRLLEHGIPITDRYGFPLLQVTVETWEEAGVYVYRPRVAVTQVVRVESTDRRTVATTWDRGRLERATAATFRTDLINRVLENIEAFSSDYRAENPR